MILVLLYGYMARKYNLISQAGEEVSFLDPSHPSSQSIGCLENICAHFPALPAVVLDRALGIVVKSLAM